MNNRKRAKALETDIQTMNPEQYQKMKKQGNVQKQLEKILDCNEENMNRTLEILKSQIPAGLSPLERKRAEAAAEMEARELAQEEISNLY